MSDIKDGDVIILQRLNYLRSFMIDTKNGTKVPQIQLSKETIDMSGILGHPYNSTFKMVKKQGGKRQPWQLELTTDVASQMDNVASTNNGEDNRDIIDKNSSQKLTKDEIEGMKSEGKIGSEMIATLVENSQSFEKKTKFSQAKFLNKKAGKYFEYLVIRRPTLRLLMQIQYAQDPTKVLNLRTDSLAQLLQQADIRSGGKYMVYETGCQGLIVAGALERIGIHGNLVHIYQTGNPQTQALQAMNFPAEVMRNLQTLNMYHLRSLEQGQEISKLHQDQPPKDEKKIPYRQRLREESVSSFNLMREKTMDGLIIACKQHPMAILETLLPYLAPSRPFAVFCSYKEPLVECYSRIKGKGGIVMATLSETWLRKHQVLPGRTHPEVMMSGSGGYILSGIKVLDSFDEPNDAKRIKAS